MCDAFSLTPALSRWERENSPPSQSKPAPGFAGLSSAVPDAFTCCSLSQRERVRVRENGAFQFEMIILKRAPFPEQGCVPLQAKSTAPASQRYCPLRLVAATQPRSVPSKDKIVLGRGQINSPKRAGSGIFRDGFHYEII